MFFFKSRGIWNGTGGARHGNEQGISTHEMFLSCLHVKEPFEVLVGRLGFFFIPMVYINILCFLGILRNYNP